MNSKGKIWWVMGFVLLTAASCGKSPEPMAQEEVVPITTQTEESATTAPVTTPTVAAKTVTITYTDSGFSPAKVSVNKGDSVKFVNNSSDSFWPASDPHPIHTGLSSFDAKKSVAAGGSYSMTFTTSGTFGFHNHLNPSAKGSVTVQ